MRILISHPTGNANVRAAAEAFHSVGWLTAFHTGLAWPAYPWLPAALQRRGVRLPARLLKLHPQLEPARLLAVRAGLKSFIRHEAGPLSVDRVYHQVDASVAASLIRAAHRSRPLPQVVYAYEDGAHATFEAARRLGVTTVYELPIGYWRFARRLFQEEAQRRPAWASTLDGLADSPAKLARKDAELALAQHIVVPSRFVQRTLAESPHVDASVTVLPYGCPTPLSELPERTTSGPLRVLFVGGLSQRKGLADLLEAVDRLGSAVRLTLIGRSMGGNCAPLQAALGRHRWLGSLPRSAVLAEMRGHDVLVLPSLFEGFPLVIGEALAQGLPVIATPHAAAEEFVVHGQHGYVVPIRDPESIAQHLEQMLLLPDLRRSMAREALQRAASWTWSDYRSRLRDLMNSLFV